LKIGQAEEINQQTLPNKKKSSSGSGAFLVLVCLVYVDYE